MAQGRNILGRLIDSIRSFLSGGSTPEQTLQKSAKEMMQTLELQANATSFAMARADEVRRNLQSELDNHEALRREAENFLAQGDEAAARRLVGLQLQSGEKIARLKEEYAALQAEAEQKVAEYRKSEDDVRKRVEALPKLQQEAQILREEEAIQKRLGAFDITSPQNEFDRIERELDIKRKQIANRSLLTADPNAELDRRIQQAIGQRKIDDAMEALRKRVAEKGVIDAEFTEEAAPDSVAEARRAREAGSACQETGSSGLALRRGVCAWRRSRWPAAGCPLRAECVRPN